MEYHTSTAHSIIFNTCATPARFWRVVGNLFAKFRRYPRIAHPQSSQIRNMDMRSRFYTDERHRPAANADCARCSHSRLCSRA
jgi:hypothetical protein